MLPSLGRYDSTGTVRLFWDSSGRGTWIRFFRLSSFDKGPRGGWEEEGVGWQRGLKEALVEGMRWASESRYLSMETFLGFLQDIRL